MPHAKDYKHTRVCLRTLVASLHCMALKALSAHWNVSGPLFGPLHELFGAQYAFLLKKQDEIAERVRALGGLIEASGTEFAKNSEVKEQAIAPLSPHRMLLALLGDYDSLVQCLRDKTVSPDIDSITQNFLQDICAQFEKEAWMLRMHVVQMKKD